MSIMRRSSFLLASCLVVMVWTHGPNADEEPALEIARVRHHLEGAEGILVSRDDATFSESQRAARARCVANLRAYIQRGVFPHNHQVVGRRTPVFVDEHGTRCAMAFLIERSGEPEMVARIARTRNLARIRDLAGDASLASWLVRNGITLDEAARIQPTYDGAEPDGGPDAGVWAASALGLGMASTGVGINLSIGKSESARNTRGLLGVALGIAGVGLGSPGLAHGGAARVFGAVDAATGIAAIALGFRQLNAVDGNPQAATHSIIPAVWCDLRGTRRVAVVARF
ncbi:MAG: hypothetical protein ABIU54_04385 [Candidatus Eisenbacteria bacterium]